MITPQPNGERYIVARVEGSAGRITINRPQALNALTLEMVRAFYIALREFECDPLVQIVIVDGAGARGLCAGGDIRAAIESVKRGDGEAAQFWREEYLLNAAIANCSKPYIALMDGLVLGGGVGISAHGSHRVASERLRLAMPEVKIGFIPDVGGTWLLSRSPGELGTYLALTGDQISAEDARTANLADYIVDSSDLRALVEELCAARHDGNASQSVGAIIGRYAKAPKRSQLAEWRPQIDAAFNHDSVERILDALDRADAEPLRAAATRIRANSPSGLKVALRALRKARQLATLEQCLAMEYRVGLRLAVANDFSEGVRAAVIDKGDAPRWWPPTLASVRAQTVEGYFEPLGASELWRTVYH